MYFLAQAAGYSFKDRLEHTFAFGTKADLNELRAYLAAHYGTTKDRVAVYHTGRSALAVAIRNLVPTESEVIVTSLTCFAVVEAVRAADCEAVFADIDRETLHFGAKELEAALALHPDAKAIIVQNNLGIPCDIKGIEKICKKHNIVIIEDLAHSAGIKYKDGREAGTVGAAVVLSFGKGKAIDTISGGAVIFTGDDAPTVKQPLKKPGFSKRFRDRWYPCFGAIIRHFYRLGKLGKYFTSFLLKIHFIERSADAELSTRTRLTYWQAKLALKQLKSLPRHGRKPIRDHYFVEDRDEVLAELEKAGFVFTDTWYDSPVSPARYYKRADFPEDECPNAVEAARTLLNFPTFYSPHALKPALKIIEPYLITDAPEAKKPVAKVAKPAKTVKAKKAPEIKPEFEYTDDEKVSEDEMAAILTDHWEEPEEPPKQKTVKEPEETEPEEFADELPELHGSISYSELTYDKLDKSHLDRTNIIDTSVNSDGTVSALTKEERTPKPKPVKNNLPKMKQYKRPGPKDPEQTEGKVW